MAFVLPTGAVGACSLTGTRVAAPAVCANATIAMRAGGDATATRRAVLAGALAAAGVAILPGNAMAKEGDGAKQSFFGAGAISNPFTYNEKSKGPVIYKVRTCVPRGLGGGLDYFVLWHLSLTLARAGNPANVRRQRLFWFGVAFVAHAWCDVLTFLCFGLCHAPAHCVTRSCSSVMDGELPVVLFNSRTMTTRRTTF